MEASIFDFKKSPTAVPIMNTVELIYKLFKLILACNTVPGQGNGQFPDRVEIGPRADSI